MIVLAILRKILAYYRGQATRHGMLVARVIPHEPEGVSRTGTVAPKDRKHPPHPLKEVTDVPA